MKRNQSLENILPPKQSYRFGGYYDLHMKSVVAEYTSNKVTAQIWRLLSHEKKSVIGKYSSTKTIVQIWRLLWPAYEVSRSRVYFQQSNCADLAATIPQAYEIGHWRLYSSTETTIQIWQGIIAAKSTRMLWWTNIIEYNSTMTDTIFMGK